MNAEYQFDKCEYEPLTRNSKANLTRTTFHKCSNCPTKCTLKNVNKITQVVPLTDDVLAKGKRIMQSISACAAKNFETVTRRLRNRLFDSNRCKDILEDEINQLMQLTDVLQQYTIELKSAVNAINEAVHIWTDNINAHKRLSKRDVLEIVVEGEYIKEIDTLIKSAERYNTKIEECNKQIEDNRKTKEELECIWSDKHEASVILDFAGHLNAHTTYKQSYPMEVKAYPNPNYLSPNLWIDRMHDALYECQTRKFNTTKLTNEAMDLITDVSMSIVTQMDRVNVSLQNHLSHLTSTLDENKGRLKNKLEEIKDTEEYAVKLHNSITEMENYLKLSQTRLHLQSDFPALEKVRHSSHEGVMEDVHALVKMIQELKIQQGFSQKHLKLLQNEQLILEKLIWISENSIDVYGHHGVKHRCAYPNIMRLMGRLE